MITIMLIQTKKEFRREEIVTKYNNIQEHFSASNVYNREENIFLILWDKKK